MLGDGGFTTRATLAAMLELDILFIFGFGRVATVKARLQTLSRQQRVALRDGGAIRLGECPWDNRLRLFAVGARSPTDHRGPWVYVTSLRSAGPQQLAALYRRRGRVEQTIDELSNGHDLNHLVSYRLHPNRIAVGFRLLARNLAIGQQLEAAAGAPTVIREPLAFRTAHVHGLGVFIAARRTLLVLPVHRVAPQKFTLGWTRRVVKLAS